MSTRTMLEFGIENLRIGNLLKSETFGICRVIGIKKNKVWISANFGDEHEVEFISLSRIKLSHNWLEAFDFECVQDDFEDGNEIVPDEEDGETLELFELAAVAPIHRRDICFFVRMLISVSWNGNILEEKVPKMFYSDTYDYYNPYIASTEFVNDLQNFYYYTVGFDLIIKKPQCIKL